MTESPPNQSGTGPDFEPPAPIPQHLDPTEPRPPGRATRTSFLIVGAAAAVIVTAVLAWSALGVGRTAGPPDVLAKSAVEGYLEALAIGDAAAALSYAAVTPSETSMLTDEVLAASLETNPMSGIAILESSGSATQQSVQALYKVSDRQVGATFDVLLVGDRWLLSSVSTAADLSRLEARELGLRLNGVPLATDTPQLFVGTYTLTSSDPRIEITGSTFFVESFRYTPNTAEITVELNE